MLALWLIARSSDRYIMAMPAPRTPQQTVEHLLERRRLAVCDLDVSALRIEAIERALEAKRTGEKIPRCPSEDADPEAFAS